MASGDRVTGERYIENVFEGSGRDLIEALSWHLPGQTERNHGKLRQSVCLGIYSNREPPGLAHYTYINLLGTKYSKLNGKWSWPIIPCFNSNRIIFITVFWVVMPCSSEFDVSEAHIGRCSQLATYFCLLLHCLLSDRENGGGMFSER